MCDYTPAHLPNLMICQTELNHFRHSDIDYFDFICVSYHGQKPASRKLMFARATTHHFGLETSAEGNKQVQLGCYLKSGIENITLKRKLYF